MVPGIASRSRAVASVADDAQTPISPAPTSVAVVDPEETGVDDGPIGPSVPQPAIKIHVIARNVRRPRL
jgi:hypothetical protein